MEIQVCLLLLPQAGWGLEASGLPANELASQAAWETDREGKRACPACPESLGCHRSPLILLPRKRKDVLSRP